MTSSPAAAPPASTPQRVEITGGRGNDADQRRQSTAAKIVIGREEIDKFGDATVGEVLRRAAAGRRACAAWAAATRSC